MNEYDEEAKEMIDAVKILLDDCSGCSDKSKAYGCCGCKIGQAIRRGMDWIDAHVSFTDCRDKFECAYCAHGFHDCWSFMQCRRSDRGCSFRDSSDWEG